SGDGGVAVAGRVDGDAGREVEVLVAVGGGHAATAARDDLQIGDLEPHVGEVRPAAQPRHGTPRRSDRQTFNEAAWSSASAQPTRSRSSRRNGITRLGMFTPSTPRRRPAWP